MTSDFIEEILPTPTYLLGNLLKLSVLHLFVSLLNGRFFFSVLLSPPSLTNLFQMASKVMRDINKDSPEDSGVKNTDLEQDASRSVVSFQSHAIEPTKKNIGAIALAALAFNICNSWAAVASTFAIAIASGGTFTLIYGILLISVVYLAVAITLAELASAYPTAGGQYHYTSIIAPGGLSRGLSYICGIAATCSWVFLAASIEIVAAQLVLAFPSYYVHDYHSREWHYFLISQLVNLVILMYNIFGLRRTPWVHKIGCEFHRLHLACLSQNANVRIAQSYSAS